MQRCPHCQSEQLEHSERSGVKTDYCPQCDTWLDEKRAEEPKKREKRERIKDTSELEEKPPMPPPVEDAQVKKNM